MTDKTFKCGITQFVLTSSAKYGLFDCPQSNCVEQIIIIMFNNERKI